MQKTVEQDNLLWYNTLRAPVAESTGQEITALTHGNTEESDFFFSITQEILKVIFLSGQLSIMC